MNTVASKECLPYNEMMKRKIIVCGHYGSGKTEFSLNLAYKLSKEKGKTALVDLDIANVYFRSRELSDFLTKMGIGVFGSAFKHEVTAEIPALAADIRKPLEDSSCFTVIDVGGNDSGAKILNQFTKYFPQGDYEMYCVINANRPETDTVRGALNHINSIEEVTGLNITGLVNNTHMLTQTSENDIKKGYELCVELSNCLDIPLIYNCYPDFLQADRIKELFNDGTKLFSIRLFMRPKWLDM